MSDLYKKGKDEKKPKIKKSGKKQSQIPKVKGFGRYVCIKCNNASYMRGCYNKMCKLCCANVYDQCEYHACETFPIEHCSYDYDKTNKLLMKTKFLPTDIAMIIIGYIEDRLLCTDCNQRINGFEQNCYKCEKILCDDGCAKQVGNCDTCFCCKKCYKDEEYCDGCYEFIGCFSHCLKCKSCKKIFCDNCKFEFRDNLCTVCNNNKIPKSKLDHVYGFEPEEDTDFSVCENVIDLFNFEKETNDICRMCNKNPYAKKCKYSICAACCEDRNCPRHKINFMKQRRE